MRVSDCIVAGSWCLPDFLIYRDPDLASQILQITLPTSNVPDSLNWNMATDWVLTSKLAYSFLAGNGLKVHWHKLIWNTYTTPTRAFISWRFIHNKLPTDDNLRKGDALWCLSVAFADHRQKLLIIFF